VSDEPKIHAVPVEGGWVDADLFATVCQERDEAEKKLREVLRAVREHELYRLNDTQLYEVAERIEKNKVRNSFGIGA